MKFKLLPLLFLLVFSIKAQDVKVEISPEYKLEKRKQLAGHLLTDETGHYMYFRKVASFSIGGWTPKPDFVLEKFDKKFKLKYSKSLKIEAKDRFALQMYSTNGNLVLLSKFRDKKAKKNKYYISKIGLDGKVKGKPSKIATIDMWKVLFFNGTYPSYMIFSQDTSRVLFCVPDISEKRKDDYLTQISVMDSDFNPIWKKKIKLPYEARRVKVNSWTVTANGDVFFIAKIYGEKGFIRESKKGKAAYEMKLFKVSENGDKKTFELNLDDSFVKGMKIKEANDGKKLNLVGFTSDSRRGPLQGIVYMQVLQETGEIIFAKKRNFTLDELDSFGKKNTSKDRKSKDRGLDDEFKFKEIRVAEDGSMWVVAQEEKVVINSHTDANGNTKTTTTFHNNEILVFSINAEGVVENVGIIPKRHRKSKSGYPSRDIKNEPVTDFHYNKSIVTDKNIYFFYNDDDDNFRKDVINPDKYKRLSSFSDAVTVVAHFDDNGKLHRKELLTGKEVNSLLMPKYCEQISDNQIFFFNKKWKFLSKNNFRFGVMTITD